MIPWTVLGNAEIPNGGGELKLSRRGDEFSIRLSGVRGELMNSRVHGSEEALAELGCAHLHLNRAPGMPDAQVLVGGLGMGFTLAAALKTSPASATVTVAELIPAVVDWNHGPLGECAGQPLQDPRTRVQIGDVAELFTKDQPGYDAILLDVDNGPEGLTHTDNHRLYSSSGLRVIYRSLRADGMLAVWSAFPDPSFVARLKKTGFTVRAQMVRARPGKGSRHTIFLAKKP
ncbi:MAG: spermidine synthase [Motiliproteus sp.]|jgi:spermidine synthase